MDTEIGRVDKFSGRLRVPPDKSLTHRAVFLSSLADGDSTIENPLTADDCLSTLRCMEQLGCRMKIRKNQWTVTGHGLWNLKSYSKPLDCGNSGTTMRLLSGILAAQDFESVLTGDASLSKRPMDRVSDPLEAMGAHVSLTQEKYPPIKIFGTKNLKPIHWKNPVASAQVKSAVLLAGLHAKGETSFEEPSLSRDHTERMLKASGVPIRREGNKVFIEGPSPLRPQKWIIPGDFSSAAFFLVAALLIDRAKVTLQSVNVNPTRTGLLKVLEKMGAQFEIQFREEGGEPIADLVVRGKQRLKGGSVNHEIAPHLIDEIPILAVAATQAEGTTAIRGVEELRFKETDRLKAMAQNLSAMGAKIKEEPGGLLIEGPTPLHGAAVGSFDDHRVAMSTAIAALIADGETVIKRSECVAISYPDFWENLARLSGQ